MIHNTRASLTRAFLSMKVRLIHLCYPCLERLWRRIEHTCVCNHLHIYINGRTCAYTPPRRMPCVLAETVQIGLSSSKEALESTKLELQKASSVGRPLDRVVLTVHPSFASQHLQSLGSWDKVKRQTVRGILDQARQNFHMHPRPWWVYSQRGHFCG